MALGKLGESPDIVGIVTRCRWPLSVYHGTKDDTAPIHAVLKVFEYTESVVHVIDGGTHSLIFDADVLTETHFGPCTLQTAYWISTHTRSQGTTNAKV